MKNQKNLKEAFQSKFKKEWQEAMNEECHFCKKKKKKNSWELVIRLENRRVVRYKWIFRIKEGLASFELRRFKAKRVAKGYTKKECVDFKEVFSLVVKHDLIRVLLTLTIVQDMELDQIDFKTAFLHGRL